MGPMSPSVPRTGTTAMTVGMSALRDTRVNQRTIALLLGDVIAITVVLSFGLLRHGVVLFEAPIHAAVVIVPFLGGYLFVAPLIGVYVRVTAKPLRAMLGRPLLAWIPSAIVGAGVRAHPNVPGSAPPIFVVVVLIFGGLAVGGWRFIAAVSLRLRAANNTEE